MNSKDIGTCILRNINNRNTLFSLSLVCKSYNRAFNEMKKNLIKRLKIDMEDYNLFRDYNLKLQKNKTQRKVSDNILREKVEKFMDKAYYETRKHTVIMSNLRMMCKYSKSLNIDNLYIHNKVEDALVTTFKKAKFYKYRIKRCRYESIYNVYNKDKLHLHSIILRHDNIIRVINVQLFKRYIVGFATKIVKRKKAKGNIYIYRSAWNLYYSKLVPLKIKNEWNITVKHSRTLFEYNGHIE